VTWLWILIAVVVVLLLVGIYLFNRIIRLRNEVNTGWSNIDVQLKRRNDLIPNLVETVKAYAAHERGVFEEVTAARAAMANASSPAAAGEADSLLGQALGRRRRLGGMVDGFSGSRVLRFSGSRVLGGGGATARGDDVVLC